MHIDAFAKTKLLDGTGVFHCLIFHLEEEGKSWIAPEDGWFEMRIFTCWQLVSTDVLDLIKVFFGDRNSDSR